MNRSIGANPQRELSPVGLFLPFSKLVYFTAFLLHLYCIDAVNHGIISKNSEKRNRNMVGMDTKVCI